MDSSSLSPPPASVIPSVSVRSARKRSGKDRMRTNLVGQMRSLLYRAYLLKKRTPRQTAFEILLMGIFSLMAAAVGFYFKPVHYPGKNVTTFYNTINEMRTINSMLNGTQDDGELTLGIAPRDKCESLKKAMQEMRRLEEMMRLRKAMENQESSITVTDTTQRTVPASTENPRNISIDTGSSRNTTPHWPGDTTWKSTFAPLTSTEDVPLTSTEDISSPHLDLPTSERPVPSEPPPFDVVCKDTMSQLKHEIVGNTRLHAPYGVFFYDYFNYTIVYRPVMAAKRDDRYSTKKDECRDIGTGGCMSEMRNLIKKCPTAAHCGTTTIQYIVNSVLLICLRNGVLDSCAPGLRLPQLTFSFNKTDSITIREDPNTVLIMTLMMVLSTTPFVNFILVNVVSEKESRLTDGFKMMGMSDLAYGLSWFVVYSIQGLIGSLLASIVLVLPEIGIFRCPQYFFAFFVGFFLYTESVIAVGLLFSTFFRRAVLAGVVGSISNLIFALIYLFVYIATGDVGATCTLRTTLRFAYLASSALFAKYFEGLVKLQREMTEEMTCSSLSIGQLYSEKPDACHTLAEMIAMLIGDILIYAVLTAYLNYALSGAYTGLERWFFFLTPSFWYRRKLTPERIQEMLQTPSSFVKPMIDIETPPKSLQGKESVRFVSLRKEFNNGESVAVKGLSFDMYKDQITCLLGHNGAGKTTVINMMTGIMRPTYGTILVNGRDVTYPPDMAEIRRSMGICPQFDILYHHMTVEEHLRMVGYMKGGTGQLLTKAIAEMLAELQLSDEVAKFQIKNCSLGTKRKVSVAMSLLFDPEIVFLDEPTSGMDPAARRQVWDVLKRRKIGKTILLTTHFMDEADILSDRKAIMSHGHMLCCGSSLFLKTRFGIGYTLHMSINAESDVMGIVTIVQQSIPSAKVVRNLKKEVVFLLPLNAVGSFADLFAELESCPDVQPRWKELGVLSFGISMTTLEEVFLRLSSEDSPRLMKFASPVEAILQDKPPNHEETKEAMKEKFELRKTDPIAHGGPRGQAAIDYSMIIEHMEDMPVTRVSFLKAFWSLMSVWLRLGFKNVYTVGYRALLPILLVLTGFGILYFFGGSSDNGKHEPVWSMYGCTKIPINCSVGGKSAPATCHAADAQALAPNVTCRRQNRTSTYDVTFDSSAYHMMPFATTKLFNYLFTIKDKCSKYLGKELCKQGIRGKPGKMAFTVDVIPSDKRPVMEVTFYMIFSTVLIGLGLLSPCPSFATEIVKARESRIAVMLSLNGIKFAQYWLSIFLAHFLQTLPIVVLLPLLAMAFKVEFLEDSGAQLSFFFLALSSMVQNILLCYVMSFSYDRSDSCMTMLPPTLFILGYVPFMLPAIMLLADEADAAVNSHTILCFVDPVYVIFGGILFISKANKMARIESKTADVAYYFNAENRVTLAIGANILHCFLCVTLLWFIETMRMSQFASKMAKTSRKPTIDDPEVEQLRKYAKDKEFLETDASGGKPPLLMLDSVGLRYAPTRAQKIRRNLQRACFPHLQPKSDEGTTAVDDLCLAIYPGEVFGLLGPSGAGKTSTLNLITGEKRLTCGEIWISGLNMATVEARRMNMVGYCPETDALWDDMKLVDHIRFYSLINGLNADQTQFVVNFLLDVLQIREHSNKLTKNLSGGTKRKVSFALSTLRCPKVVLLDEPSTGMDPQSKRFLWEAVMLSFTGNRCAVLTTQSMEEAEYLCDRVGIIVRGQLKCVGSSANLTNRYGTGYYLEIRAAYPSGSESVSAAKDASDSSHSYVPQSHLEMILGRKARTGDKAVIKFVEENFPGAMVVEAVSDNMIFHIPRALAPKLSYSFRILEEAKNAAPPLILEYSLSQASLEQVFLRFAKSQSVPGEAPDLHNDHDGEAESQV